MQKPALEYLVSSTTEYVKGDFLLVVQTPCQMINKKFQDDNSCCIQTGALLSWIFTVTTSYLATSFLLKHFQSHLLPDLSWTIEIEKNMY